MKPVNPGSPHLASPVELNDRLAAERAGKAFLVYRDHRSAQQIVPLTEEARPATIGRVESDICLAWDEHVSSLHAELRRVGNHWLVVDDGLSLNGTYVNGDRVRGRRRLRDGDQLAVGQTMLVFRDPASRPTPSTVARLGAGSAPELSPAQRRVLVALCRPFKSGSAFARPATNQQIAAELYLSVDAVKKHLRTLFEKFGVSHLPQNEKRARLVERAFAGGFISEQEL